MNIVQIIAIIVIIISFLFYIFTIYYNKIKSAVLKINSIENEIDTSLREKYDLFTKLISEIQKNDKDEKRFKEFDKIKDENLSSFEFERKLNEIESIIFTIKNDNEKLQKNNSFSDTWYDVININTVISANIKYYNENITNYNQLICKFPGKIIALVTKYKEKRYFDQKDMYDKNIKDFKI